MKFTKCGQSNFAIWKSDSKFGTASFLHYSMTFFINWLIWSQTSPILGNIWPLNSTTFLVTFGHRKKFIAPPEEKPLKKQAKTAN